MIDTDDLGLTSTITLPPVSPTWNKGKVARCSPDIDIELDDMTLKQLLRFYRKKGYTVTVDVISKK